MSPKKNSTKGFLISHTPIQLSLFSSVNSVTDTEINATILRNAPQQSVKTNNARKDQKGSKETHNKSQRPSQTLRQERHSCPSIRNLQAKMKTEHRQKRENMKNLVNMENGFIKEMEKMLNQRDVAEQRRRELLHKQWTERVWLPLQKQLHQRVSSCGAIDINRRQSFYSHFLQHTNSKGYVFLDTYNLKEYDPFFRPLKRSHHLKVTNSKNGLKEAWMPDSTNADSTNSGKQSKPPHPLQSSLVSCCSMTSDSQRKTPCSYAFSTPTYKKGKTARGTLSSRFNKIPCHIEKYSLSSW